MKLVVVSAGLSSPSSTRLLADRLAAATVARVDAEVQVIELRDHATEIAQHFVTGFPPARLAAALDAVAAADGLIAVSPVFSASYSGLFKSFFDLIDKDALTGKPVLLGATGGTARHSLVTEHALRPLFTYLRALALPTAVYAASEDWGEDGLAHRITRAGDELARFMAPASAVGTAAPDVDTAAAIAPRSLHGAITSVDPQDGFGANLVPFEQRLAALRPAE
ncbi:CE1759 family FMN reductase [Streptomyces sp. VRA16 Mangrove soil]|uniref:CE1759 family FMN reductase n=1 Tax=Streptomyces sp. VRA16 Mangrove soil TaxID=2817434 RepID=UPI001A9E2BDA|nr:CE1759 family FMN reductase [Streptomyces sp. VRA16 Mangrove soil]MBO1337813.1 NAD(P)H-dependent oxidoreductase [Streptomyces sp. VRA16 Mangrove soil]